MIRYYFRSTTTSAVQQFRKPKFRSVAVVTNATKEDIKDIAVRTDLSFDDVDDISARQEIPRLERRGDSMLFFLRCPRDNMDINPHTQLLMLIYNKSKLSVVSPNDENPIPKLLTMNSTLITAQSSKLLIHLLLAISDDFAQKINLLHGKVEKVKERLRNATNEDIETLIDYESILTDYISALVPMQNMYKQILSGTYFPLYAEDEALFEDVLISIAQSVDVCKVSIKNIVSLRDSFEIIFTNRLNQTVKLLTSVTIIITIPTLIASIFGMNVALPWEERDLAFGMIMLLIMGVTGLIILLFRQKKWL